MHFFIGVWFENVHVHIFVFYGFNAKSLGSTDTTAAPPPQHTHTLLLDCSVNNLGVGNALLKLLS
jgi:hypothetical protein